MYRSYFKRPIDFVASVALLIVLSPFIFITTLLIIWQNRGKAFFTQERPGRNEKPFKIIKFKTMTDQRNKQGELLPDKDRLTEVGKWVRKLSLDELPQLINVLKGEMSIIGPRPLLFKYVPLYSPEQRKRHLVRPGITGLAQVNGRNSITWSEKFRHDVYYVNKLSFGLDIKILILTIVKVLKREGINQSSDVPMRPFDGSN